MTVKPKEFWIEQFNGRVPPTLYAYDQKPDSSNCRVVVNGKEFPAREHFHVIEYSAFTQLQNQLEEKEREIAELNKQLSEQTTRVVNVRSDWLEERAKVGKMRDALKQIEDWWDVSDPTRVVPAKKPNELMRNDSMAAASIINAINALKEAGE